MAVRQIRVIGDEILNKKCKPVKEMTDRTKELIEDMFETMYDETKPWIKQLDSCR